MTDTERKEFDEDRKTCEAATPGPWIELFHKHKEALVPHWTIEVRDGILFDTLNETANADQEHDSEFVGAARSRWPIALAKIAEQERVIEDLRIELRSICRNILDGANRGKISGIVPGYLDTVRAALALAYARGK